MLLNVHQNGGRRHKGEHMEKPQRSRASIGIVNWRFSFCEPFFIPYFLWFPPVNCSTSFAFTNVCHHHCHHHVAISVCSYIPETFYKLRRISLFFHDERKASNWTIKWKRTRTAKNKRKGPPTNRMVHSAHHSVSNTKATPFSYNALFCLPPLFSSFAFLIAKKERNVPTLMWAFRNPVVGPFP